MTICDPLLCPFLGCASCEYAGGVGACAATEYGKIGSTQTAPDQRANAAEGLTIKTELES